MKNKLWDLAFYVCYSGVICFLKVFFIKILGGKEKKNIVWRYCGV